MAARFHRRGVLGDESGYALVEFMLVAAMLVVVLGALLALAELTQRITPRDQERAHVIRDAQVGVHQMTRELRQAHVVNGSGAYSMDVNLVRNGQNTRVIYECDKPHPSEATYNRCLRFVVGADGTKTGGDVVVDRLLNGPAGSGLPVFTYQSNGVGQTTYATVTVEVPAKGDLKLGHKHRVTLHDGFYMRNRDED